MKRVNIKNIIPLIISVILLAGIISGCALSQNTNNADGSNQLIPPVERHIENLNNNNDSGSSLGSASSGVDGIYDDTLYSGDISPDMVDGERSGENLDKSDRDSADGSESGESDYSVGKESSGIAFSDLRIYSDDEIRVAGAGNAGRFAYERISADDKKIYNEMLLALNEMTEGANLDCFDSDRMNRIFQCVMMDHPELFWVTGYVYSTYTLGDTVEAIGFKGSYSINSAEKNSRQMLIDQYVANCMAGMPAGDDYTKIKYVYEYIINHTEYDLAAPDNQNICSVFIGNRSVCLGYAKATQYLLNRAGIMCTLVSGVTGDNQNHAWNLVSADGAYYFVDTTWGDASYRVEGGSGDFTPAITYDYLCVTTAEISRTHIAQPLVELPLCGSYNDNYFVREGAFFTSMDTDRISNLFASYQNAGREYVTLKCSDQYVYSSIKDYLINNQHVFDYLDGETGKISYWESPELMSISFKF